MPKIRRARSLSLERSRTSPYPVDPNSGESCNNVNSLESAQNVREWEQARCPICIEHPHNAVLLKCSSYERGCRPFMCNTSYRHSNCFEQFCKLYGPIPLITELQETPFTSVASHRQMDECLGLGGNQLASELICPLCRGGIDGYMVVEPARQYMNSKLRSCSSETCDFSGAYSELRKHARSEHPYVRPSEEDPVRRHDWEESQRESDYDDMLSLMESDSAEDSDEDLSVTRTFRFFISSFATEMYGSLMDLISQSMLDSWRELETLQSRLDNLRRELHSNVSTHSNVPTEVIYNVSIETRPYSQPASTLDFRSSQHMPRATQLHGQNQQQRAVESTSYSRPSQHMPRATQLHGQNQQQRAVESTSYSRPSQHMLRATQLHGQNQQQRPVESTSHFRSSQHMPRATRLHGQNQQQRAVESTSHFRSSQHMPRATQLHGQNQQQRAVESTSYSRPSQHMPRATQLHGQNQQQRAVERTSHFRSSQHMPRATQQLHGQNQQQRAVESTSHFRSSQHMPRATQLHRQNEQQRAVESTSRSRQLRWRSQTSFGWHQRSFESASHASERYRQHEYKSPPRASRLRWRNQGGSSSSSSSNHNER